MPGASLRRSCWHDAWDHFLDSILVGREEQEGSNPMSWASFLEDYAGGRIPDDHGDTDPHLQLLNVLHTVFLGAVDGASYEYLREVNSSMAAFVVCNATLRRTGQSCT